MLDRAWPALAHRLQWFIVVVAFLGVIIWVQWSNRSQDDTVKDVKVQTCQESADARLAVRSLIVRIVRGYDPSEKQAILDLMDEGLPPLSCP